MGDAPVLEIRGLAKRYGRFEALKGLDLTVQQGEVYGFLGRNGAGKTTTIRILMGITQASKGELRMFGERASGDHVSLRQKIGYVAQEQNFYPWMTPRTVGRFVRAFYPTWSDDQYGRLVHAFDLPHDRKIGNFSGGMKAKLALALALAHDPQLLLLDEPTAGLDPVARREFLDMVRDQAERSRRTTFFSSHLLGEVEQVADRLGIVDEGRTRYEGGLRELSDRVRILRHPVTSTVDATGLARTQVPPLPPSLSREAGEGRGGGHFEIFQDRVRRGERQVVVRASSPEQLATVLEGAPGWTIEPLSLEDIFVEMVSKPLAATA